MLASVSLKKKNNSHMNFKIPKLSFDQTSNTCAWGLFFFYNVKTRSKPNILLLQLSPQPNERKSPCFLWVKPLKSSSISSLGCLSQKSMPSLYPCMLQGNHQENLKQQHTIYPQNQTKPINFHPLKIHTTQVQFLLCTVNFPPITYS